MKQLIAMAALLMAINTMAKLSVETTENSADSQSSAPITITGKEAKKLIDYLSEVSRYSGSFVAHDAGMGKYYISAPGISCRTFNLEHLGPQERDLDRIYNCEVSFGATGSIQL